MFYKEQLLNDSNTEGPQSLFHPQKFCNYLMGKCREPGSSQRCKGVRQEATDKFKYKKLRPKEEKFSLEGDWILEHIAQSDCGLSITGDPWNSAGKGPKQPHPTGPALSSRLTPHGFPRSLQPACSYDSMKLCFGCTMRQILLFFLFNSIIIFICTDLPGTLKTGRSLQSMLRIREVPKRVSFILLVLMRTTKRCPVKLLLATSLKVSVA